MKHKRLKFKTVKNGLKKRKCKNIMAEPDNTMVMKFNDTTQYWEVWHFGKVVFSSLDYEDSYDFVDFYSFLSAIDSAVFGKGASVGLTPFKIEPRT